MESWYKPVSEDDFKIIAGGLIKKACGKQTGEELLVEL